MRPSLSVWLTLPLLSRLYCPGRARPGSIQLSPLGRRSDVGDSDSLRLSSSFIGGGRLLKLASD
jgi:hypothetical protein